MIQKQEAGHVRIAVEVSSGPLSETTSNRSPHRDTPPFISVSPDCFRRGGQPEVGPDRRRVSEPRGVVDCVAESERCHHADPRHRHQSAGGFVFLGKLVDPPVQPIQLAADMFVDREQRPQHRPEQMPSQPIGLADQLTSSKRTSGWSERSSSCLDRPSAQTSSSRVAPLCRRPTRSLTGFPRMWI